MQTRFPGWIQKVFANATYQYVRKGQPVFTIYSPDLVSTEQEYLLAKQNQQTFASDMHGTAAHESDWLLQAAADRLRQFGVPPGEIARLEQTGTVEHDVSIDSPASGYITEFNALPNQYVQPDTKLYTIADLSTVWVYANVFQTDVGALKPGMPATVTVDAYPGRTFKGRIDQILPQVDVATRTARVRFVFDNPRNRSQARHVRECQHCGPARPPACHSRFWRPAVRHARYRFHRSWRRLSRTA